MKLINQYDNSYILRFEIGEEFVNVIEKFSAENKISSAWFEAIGSVKNLELAFYNLTKKSYETREFANPMEIVSLTGNISKKNNDIFCHVHGVFSMPDMSTVAGHVKRCVISATCEINLRAFGGEMKREFDEETGLYLLE